MKRSDALLILEMTLDSLFKHNPNLTSSEIAKEVLLRVEDFGMSPPIKDYCDCAGYHECEKWEPENEQTS